MASDEILGRIDEHMARGNQLMEEIKREHQLNRAAYEQHSRVMIRLVEVVEQLGRRIDAGAAAIRANTESLRRRLKRFDRGGADPAAG